MSDGLGGAWGRLGIAATADQGAIRRAYADALRAMDVDADVAGFAALRQAREPAADEPVIQRADGRRQRARDVHDG